MPTSHLYCTACGAANETQDTFCFNCGRPLKTSTASMQYGTSGTTSSTQTGLLTPNLLLKQRYRIHRKLGIGGFGAVYKAEDTQFHNRLVAIEEALQIGIQLCTVLMYLHTRQPPIIFRDLKPANIMLTPDGHAYLIDFGIARLFKPGQTKDTIAFGSPGYAAPEQYGKAQTTIQSDIFSLGVILHQLLSGNDPTTNSPTLFDFPILTLPSQLTSPSLKTLIMQMVEKDTDKRPHSIAEIQKKLQQILIEQATGTISASQTTSKTPLPPTQPVSRRPFPPTHRGNVRFSKKTPCEKHKSTSYYCYYNCAYSGASIFYLSSIEQFGSILIAASLK